MEHAAATHVVVVIIIILSVLSNRFINENLMVIVVQFINAEPSYQRMMCCVCVYARVYLFVVLCEIKI